MGRKPKRGNKRAFVQRIATSLKIQYKQALSFVNAYSDAVIQGVREDGRSILPNIGCLSRALRNPRSQLDINEANMRSGGGMAQRKYKKAYIKFASKQVVRKMFEEVVDESTWNPQSTFTSSREPSPPAAAPASTSGQP
ncbi:unnamed protein product [Prorocentrum cordatum]|uniref:Uncharacterized protein n=1 Tax=Prorocentrum cordatum TaxID=2364126 RepID=A0ABN9XNM8_9DINO|nr:unnamed protein product [Polarella glacialis]CAK0909310.1 unnamed protein product [Polarella glacialis]|eukprot:9468030-Pyramimonas_sp.AAC.1